MHKKEIEKYLNKIVWIDFYNGRRVVGEIVKIEKNYLIENYYNFSHKRYFNQIKNIELEKTGLFPSEKIREMVLKTGNDAIKDFLTHLKTILMLLGGKD